jgi:hypothetical protein
MAGNALVLLSALSLVQAVHADTIKGALNHKYKNRILAPALHSPQATRNLILPATLSMPRPVRTGCFTVESMSKN